MAKEVDEKNPGLHQDLVENLRLKHCRACYSEMPIEANKCIKCSSIQDWQRFLGLSTTILGLLVALVSVLTFAVPIWKHEFYTPRPRPHIALIDPAGGNHIVFSVSNGGDAPMVLQGVEFKLQDEFRSIWSLAIDQHEHSQIIRPNEFVLFTATAGAHWIAQKGKSDLTLVPLRSIEEINKLSMNGKLQKENFQYQCQLFIAVLSPIGRVVTASVKPELWKCNSAANTLADESAEDLDNNPRWHY